MYSLAIFLPLIGALIAGFFGRMIGDKGSQYVTCGLLIASAVISVIAFIDIGIMGNTHTADLGAWISSGTFEARWALRFDALTAVMLVVVTVVSACVHVYSIGYMHHDPAIPRFMAYLSLFTFAMLMLVTSNNLLQLFFGWEGVGVCSYLLIGFWFDRPSANAAAIKAFVVNRVGDFGFALGIVGCYLLFDSIQFDVIFQAAPQMVEKGLTFMGMHFPALEIICFLLFIGAMGKSAQLGLHTWLPDAMEGPTPVSALIHAATMVTAGVFLVARMSPVFEYAPETLAFVTVIGASTAFFAATIGLVQTDIKRVIAYSTCSQLGYMFFACGVGAYPAAIFHLMTHAFFKALLFLGAGSVIHAMSDEQDMRNMGGIRKLIPKTYVLMWIGSLALAGLPWFAGFYSKDMIIESAFAAGTAVGSLAFVFGILAAGMTAFYSWRLLFMTFHGKPRADEKVMAHVHESPPIMLIPLYVLAAGAIFSGILFYYGTEMVGHHPEQFWQGSILMIPENHTLHDAHNSPLWVKYLPIVVSLFGIWLAYVFYIKNRRALEDLVANSKGLHAFLLNKWYFDELYRAIFVKPAFALGRLLWKCGDGFVIDGFGPNGIAARVVQIARGASRLQSGYVYHYAFAMLIGVVLLLTWYFGNAGA
jgi:NADH-quinone oxidoreductase subunit L